VTIRELIDYLERQVDEYGTDELEVVASIMEDAPNSIVASDKELFDAGGNALVSLGIGWKVAA
jgi:hypothetical protein